MITYSARCNHLRHQENAQNEGILNSPRYVLPRGSWQFETNLWLLDRRAEWSAGALRITFQARLCSDPETTPLPLATSHGRPLASGVLQPRRLEPRRSSWWARTVCLWGDTAAALRPLTWKPSRATGPSWRLPSTPLAWQLPRCPLGFSSTMVFPPNLPGGKSLEMGAGCPSQPPLPRPSFLTLKAPSVGRKKKKSISGHFKKSATVDQLLY